MKQLFVTHTATQHNKKHDYPNIFKCYERKEEPQIPLTSTKAPDSETQSTNTIISSAGSTTQSTTDSRKISCNFSPNENLFCINPNVNLISNNNSTKKSKNDNNFLGKKTKIRFDIIKNDGKKPIKFNNNHPNNMNMNLYDVNTNNNNNNIISRVNNNYQINNKINFNPNILNSPNSNSTEGTLINKDIEKNDSFDTLESKLETTNIFKTNKCNDINALNLKLTKDKSGVNEGRWQYEEHIKFIEAITKYGKNWKEVQKYVGSRTSAQARSHAQKFFLKLKTIKNNKFNFDFSDNKIKSLSDIIDIIKQSNPNKILDDKQYIISTLISLSETISTNDANDSNDIYRSKSCEREQNKNKCENLLNDNKDIKIEILKNFCDKDTNIKDNNIDIKKDNKIIMNNLEYKFNNNNIYNKKVQKLKTYQEKKPNLNNNTINAINTINNNYNNINNFNMLNSAIIYNNNNNNNKNGMKTMNMNNNINNNKKEDRKEVINKDQNEKSNYSFIDSNRKFRYVYDDGAIFLTDDSGFFCFDNISLRMKDYIFMENMKSPYLKFISTFFG